MKFISTFQHFEKRARRSVAALFLFSALVAGNGCSLMKPRPVQLMSDTASALRAAKEVDAETLAPELYRRANDAYFRSQNEYRMKNFAAAETYALRAKALAEEAEFSALEKGSNRTSLLPPDEPVPPPPPSTLEPPKGELATEAIRREAQGGSSQNPAGTPNSPTGTNITPGVAPGSPSAPTIPQASGPGSNFAP